MKANKGGLNDGYEEGEHHEKQGTKAQERAAGLDQTLPPQQRKQLEAFNSSTRPVATTAEEFRATPQIMAQVRSAGSLGDKPLAVVTAGEQSGPGWPEMQEELAALSSDSIHRIVEGATHVSLLYERHDVQVTSAAVEQVVEAARTDRPTTR
jgi:hypothetical protein